MTRRMLVWVVPLLLSCAARPSAGPPRLTARAGANGAFFPELPQIRTLADVRDHQGERAEIHGRYEVTPVAQGAGQPVNIVLADGTELCRAYWPIARELQLHDQPIVAIGTVHLSLLPGVEVERLMADPGARLGPEGQMPLLPQVSHKRDLERNRGRWVSLIGAVRRVRALDELHARIELELGDGTRVSADRAPLVNWRGVAPGSTVTTVGKIAGDSPTTVLGVSIPCPGNVARCGVD